MLVHRVLCPVDFSDCSRRALHYADALANRYDADLHVVHFYLEVVPPAVPLEVPKTPDGDSVRQATIEALGEFVKRAGVTRDVRRLARPGLPVQGVLDYAAEIRADLIVLGTHGRTGLDRALLGSTAERVLHSAACPVLTIPGAAAESAPRDHASFTHVLCAVDFSPASAPVVEHGLSLARDSEAKLTLLPCWRCCPTRTRRRGRNIGSGSSLTCGDRRRSSSESSASPERERVITEDDTANASDTTGRASS
jgi:universal stress protein A